MHTPTDTAPDYGRCGGLDLGMRSRLPCTCGNTSWIFVMARSGNVEKERQGYGGMERARVPGARREDEDAGSKGAARDRRDPPESGRARGCTLWCREVRSDGNGEDGERGDHRSHCSASRSVCCCCLPIAASSPSAFFHRQSSMILAAGDVEAPRPWREGRQHRGLGVDLYRVHCGRCGRCGGPAVLGDSARTVAVRWYRESHAPPGVATRTARVEWGRHGFVRPQKMRPPRLGVDMRGGAGVSSVGRICTEFTAAGAAGPRYAGGSRERSPCAGVGNRMRLRGSPLVLLASRGRHGFMLADLHSSHDGRGNSNARWRLGADCDGVRGRYEQWRRRGVDGKRDRYLVCMAHGEHRYFRRVVTMSRVRGITRAAQGPPIGMVRVECMLVLPRVAAPSPSASVYRYSQGDEASSSTAIDAIPVHTPRIGDTGVKTPALQRFGVDCAAERGGYRGSLPVWCSARHRCISAAARPEGVVIRHAASSQQGQVGGTRLPLPSPRSAPLHPRGGDTDARRSGMTTATRDVDVDGEPAAVTLSIWCIPTRSTKDGEMSTSGSEWITLVSDGGVSREIMGRSGCLRHRLEWNQEYSIRRARERRRKCGHTATERAILRLRRNLPELRRRPLAARNGRGSASGATEHDSAAAREGICLSVRGGLLGRGSRYIIGVWSRSLSLARTTSPRPSPVLFCRGHRPTIALIFGRKACTFQRSDEGGEADDGERAVASATIYGLSYCFATGRWTTTKRNVTSPEPGEDED
ncbi:hypothetical protein DFH07DRAFT_769706 [Mycena maculata]|uniref:Uncharacterized protein n=1 Tax=Mycena maculata TaxID=230809 RepID=A0AAD7JKW5_9AGAR|nr:hypothetical protein DFH07DRAFT_769706 [Mycena maculata]